MLVKNFTRVGNSYAILIDKGVLDLLDIDPDTTPVKLVTDGQSITIIPMSSVKQDQVAGYASDQQVDASLKKIKKRYHGVLKRLAK